MKYGVKVFPAVCVTEKDGIVMAEAAQATMPQTPVETLRENTMAYRILRAHDRNAHTGMMALDMDALVSPDNVYVSIIQTARASGLEEFPLPFVLTNCHNSLCSIGGTINEDDHHFGYSCARRYGGIMVPTYQAVIHQFMREQMTGCGKMIMGSDSHTRYGALGTMGIGEGGGELVKQLLRQPYELRDPQVVGVHLTGKLSHGVGPHDVALSLVGALFAQGTVKNKVLEFFGDGIPTLSMDLRMGIDAMTTELAALSSIWITDAKTEEFYRLHGRANDFKPLRPIYPVYYDGLVTVDLSAIRPMIALPFHPSNAYTIKEFNENAREIIADVEKNGRKTMQNFSLQKHFVDGRFCLYQGTVAGCVGGLYENICVVNNILGTRPGIGADRSLHIFPASQGIYHQLTKTDVAASLSSGGAILLQASCGPCFGVQDIPANNQMAMRHITRNFLNREGARPTNGQGAGVALMDARSITATICAGGALTGADMVDYPESFPEYDFDVQLSRRQIYWGYGRADHTVEPELGPNIADWPAFTALPEHLLLVVSGVYGGSVTTDELVPSGEASAYRSNPEKLAMFTLQNRDAGYYGRAKAIRDFSNLHREGRGAEVDPVLESCCAVLEKKLGCPRVAIEVGSVILSDRIGDGSAREQAASSQRVLGGRANIAVEYVTKRYRSNLINWGVLPLLTDVPLPLKPGEYLFLRGIRAAIAAGNTEIKAERVNWQGEVLEVYGLHCPPLSEDERRLLLAGCLINGCQHQAGE